MGELAKNQPTPMEMIASCQEPAAIEKLMKLQERWEADKAKKEFGHALAMFQTECGLIEKKRAYSVKGGRIEYVSIDDIMKVIKPLLSEQDMSVTYNVVTEDGKDYMECIIRHGSYSEAKRVPLVLPGNANNSAQNMGMALTYSKRYALCMALGLTITDEDNDAEFAAETVTQEQAGVIDNLLTACDFTKDRTEAFFKWAGAEDVFGIPAAKYDHVVKFLKDKAK